MIKKYYAANKNESLLHITTELGKDNIQIGVADKDLNWHIIVLNEEQSKRFKQFMRENDV